MKGRRPIPPEISFPESPTITYSMFGIAQWVRVRHYIGGARTHALHLPMPARRLDDRIRYLSTQLVGADDGEIEAILQELLTAIHEKLERLRARAANRFLFGQSIPERRASPPKSL